MIFFVDVMVGAKPLKLIEKITASPFNFEALNPLLHIRHTSNDHHDVIVHDFIGPFKHDLYVYLTEDPDEAQAGTNPFSSLRIWIPNTTMQSRHTEDLTTGLFVAGTAAGTFAGALSMYLFLNWQPREKSNISEQHKAVQ